MPDDEKPEMSAEEAAEDESEQALLPRSFFTGKDLEVGSTCKVKVEGIYDDEVSVSYVKHEKDGEKEKSDDESMDGMMSKMDSMAEPTGAPAPGGY